MKRGIVVSGGGSWGAFTAGRLQENKYKYDVVIGCSTGALMTPFIALGMYDELAAAYSSVITEDVFDRNPFHKNGNIKIANAVWSLLSGKRSMGSHLALRQTIQNFFTKDMYTKIRQSEIDVIVTVCNITKTNNNTEYKSIRDWSYLDFCDWIWASCAIPAVTTIVEKGGFEYIDGGTLEGAPVTCAVNLGCDVIDVYLHSAEKNVDKKKINNLVHLLSRVIILMRSEMREDDLRTRFNDNIKINKLFLPADFKTSAMVFDQEIMRQWTLLGREWQKKINNQ